MLVLKIGNIENPNVVAVLRHMKGNSLLISFSKIYLQQLSFRYLDQQDPKKLALFLEERFRFFQEIKIFLQIYFVVMYSLRSSFFGF